jgi:beta-N-acetylglucosaminidase
MRAFTIETSLREIVHIPEWYLRDYLRARGGGGLVGANCPMLAVSQELGITVAYMVAHAALETGWGRSAICREKKNLFGWSAFDASPYASARAFPDYAACVEYVMGRINELYLTEGGKYFAHAPCVGRGGLHGFGMNVHYATDPNWGRKIATIARNIEVGYANTYASR